MIQVYWIVSLVFGMRRDAPPDAATGLSGKLAAVVPAGLLCKLTTEELDKMWSFVTQICLSWASANGDGEIQGLQNP